MKYTKPHESFDILVDQLAAAMSDASGGQAMAQAVSNLPGDTAAVADFPVPPAAIVLVVDSAGLVISQNAAAAQNLGTEPGSALSEIMETPQAARQFLARKDFSGDPVPVVVATPEGDTILLLGVTHEEGGLITLHEVRRGLDDRVQQQLADTIGLSAGETRVYFGLLEGKTVDLIASDLHRAPGTVRQQVKAILAKAGVRSQVQLVSLAYALSLTADRTANPQASVKRRAVGTALRINPAGEVGFHRFGLPGGMPVLLFHGALFGIAALPEVQAGAHALGLDIIALERPGYGHTPMPPDGDSLTCAMTHAVQTLDALGIARAVVIAHDVGTRFAARFALTQPDRVAAVIAAPTTPPMKNWAQTADMPRRHRVNAWAAQNLPTLMDKIVMLGLSQIARKGVDLIPQFVFGDCAFDRAVMENPARAIALQDVFSLVWQQRGIGFRRDMLITNDDWQAELAGIAAPFIALHGANSQTVSRRAVEAMVASLPDGHFRLVSDAGHSLPLSHSALIFRYAFAAGMRAGLAGAEHGMV
ncbi:MULTISPECIES: alpha/beta fold hydrolase [unclassified Yoonia]|uniref:alpha/beta fold hydrolase n=1 Tax=unclassified Yoonia TaxID=2629118 RepID=UPI002AFFF984|nr:MULTISPECIES: alpha/beta fold hydrolase [unclassified Yoonia]